MKPLLFFRAENSVDAEKTLREEAGHWVVRRDRGFSQAEALEFERWLRAAPGHAAAIERSTLAWRMLDEISHPVIAKSARSHTRSTLFWPLAATGLAAAAALVIGYTGWWQSTNRTDSGRVDPVRSIAVQRTPAHLNTFSDGTIVHLNASSDVIEQFTPAERRVLLAYGEAYFSVAKNPARPFIVRARQVEVRAIGTMFDVNLQASAIEVLVTEGQVRVTSNGSTGEYVVVQAGQRATVALGTGAVRGITVASISEADEAAALTWQGSLLKLWRCHARGTCAGVPAAHRASLADGRALSRRNADRRAVPSRRYRRFCASPGRKLRSAGRTTRA